MKNLSMLGAALLISYFGAGPLSVDKRQKTHSEQRTRRMQYREAVLE
jgi:hypothetical protein